MGLNSLLQQNMQSAGLAGIDRLAGNAMFPQSQMDKTQYAVPSQLPTSAETIRADYDAKTDAYTGLPTMPFAKGGIARFYDGGTPEDKNAIVADLYQRLLGRSANEGETAQWADSIDSENPRVGIMALADRLAQTEEGTAYGKSEGNKVFQNLVELTQKDSPFAGTENPYSNMKFLGSGQDAEGNAIHTFQDQNSGIMKVDGTGKPIEYNPGAGWYDEQLRNRPDALRGTDYRNQSYLAAGPLEQSYKFNGFDVPIKAAEYQVDPKTGQFVKGKTGENVAVEWRPQGYNMWDDWAAPAAVVALPLAASYAAPYLAGEAAVAGTTAVGAGEVAGGTAAGAGATGAAGAGGAGAATASGVNGMNVLRGALLAKSLMSQLDGGSQQGYSGQGLNPNAGGTGFNPGTVSALGLPNVSGYEKTPWANLMPQITLSKLSDFDSKGSKDMAAGGMTGLGHLGDNVDGLKKAIEYLNNPTFNQYSLAR